RAFRCRVYEEYSTVENASFACECEEGSLHVSPEAGIVEIVRPDETHCDPGEVGEVVVTGLLRIHQPLVRFRLGDLAAWSADSCECGRQMPVLQEVLGRIEDVVTAPDGRKMVRFHGVFVDLPGVRRGQIRQEGREKIRVLLECTDSYEAALNDTIVARVQERLGSQVRVVVQVVDAIPLGPGGKFQAVLSRLDKGDTAR
ncbi:MAG: phenylacetate--CoA ligase family protein, partial [Thermoanaerobaculia bacterium]